MDTRMRRSANRSFVAAIGIVGGLALIGLLGCGGGGSTGPGAGGTGGVPSAAKDMTARFHVDVATGKVTISPSAGVSEANSRAIFTGTAVGFSSSVLLDQPGTIGLKTLSVALVNNWALPIGQGPDGAVKGMKVLFSNFNNVGSFSDPRTRTNVSTVAGTGSPGAVNGPIGSASFNSPTGVAAGANGTLYVTDKAGNAIRKISGGSVSTLAGNGSAGAVDGQGMAAQFNFPFGIAINPTDGALIVSDLLGNLIRRVTTDGRVTTIVGNGSASSVNGAGNAATIYGPSGVAIDPSGAIYVGEYFGQHIRKIVLTGSNPASAASYTVTTLAGSTAGNLDGVGAAAKFMQPVGLTVAPDGTVYVADQGNNSVRRVSPAGEVATIAGTGTLLTTNGTGDVASFASPRGIVYVNGALIVADRLGNILRQMTLTNGASPSVAQSWNVAFLAGTGGTGTSDGIGTSATITQPQLLAVDANGNLYVPDTNNDIRKVVPTSGSFPIGVASGLAPSEPVQLSDADGITPAQGTGTVLPFITYAGVIASGATSTVKNWNFTIPTGVTAFEFTVTVEADTTALTPPEGAFGVGSSKVVVRTFAGKGDGGNYQDGNLAVARFNGSEYLTFDAAGDMYVSDLSNNAIRRISSSGIVSTVAGASGIGFADGNGVTAKVNSPVGIAASPDGTVVYVADQGNQRIRRLSLTAGTDPAAAANWIVSTIAGTGSIGGNYDSSPGNTATMNVPSGLALDSGGNVYFSETAGKRIKRMVFLGGDPDVSSNWSVRTVAGSIVAASPLASDFDGTGNLGTFAAPQQIAFDRAGHLYIADTDNHRIRVTNVDGVVTTLAGGVNGDAPSFGYVDGPGASARFAYPVGITVDSSGIVYVAEFVSQRIRSISPRGVVSTLAGTGATGSTDGPGTSATFNNPVSLAVNPAGTLFVGSLNDNSIRMIERIIGSGTR